MARDYMDKIHMAEADVALGIPGEETALFDVFRDEVMRMICRYEFVDQTSVNQIRFLTKQMGREHGISEGYDCDSVVSELFSRRNWMLRFDPDPPFWARVSRHGRLWSLATKSDIRIVISKSLVQVHGPNDSSEHIMLDDYRPVLFNGWMFYEDDLVRGVSYVRNRVHIHCMHLDKAKNLVPVTYRVPRRDFQSCLSNLPTSLQSTQSALI